MGLGCPSASEDGTTWPSGQDTTRENVSPCLLERRGSAHTPGFGAGSPSGTRSLVLQRLCAGPQGSRKTASRTLLCRKGRKPGHPSEAGQLLHLCPWGTMHRAGAGVPAACLGSAMRCVAGGPGAAPSQRQQPEQTPEGTFPESKRSAELLQPQAKRAVSL